MNKVNIADEMILRAFKRVVIISDSYENRQVKEAIHQLSDDIDLAIDFILTHYDFSSEHAKYLSKLREFLDEAEDDYYLLEYIADLLRKRK